MDPPGRWVKPMGGTDKRTDTLRFDRPLGVSRSGVRHAGLTHGFPYFTYIRMESTISSTEAARHLGDVLARVKHAGESFVLTKSDKPLARLVPIRAATGARGDAIMEALAHLPHDVDFADDLERVNRMDREPENPWA
jgi:prevent-host-death family protein